MLVAKNWKSDITRDCFVRSRGKVNARIDFILHWLPELKYCGCVFYSNAARSVRQRIRPNDGHGPHRVTVHTFDVITFKCFQKISNLKWNTCSRIEQRNSWTSLTDSSNFRFLAVDMQLYILGSALTLYLASRRDIALKVLGALFVSSLLLNAGLAYAFDWQALVYFATPE